MKVKYKLTILLSVLAFGVLGLLVFARAGVADFAQLPPRPGDPPGETPPPAEQPAQPAVKGGFIALTMEGYTPDHWVTVQWHDGKDTWYTVSGWQGNFDHEGKVLWWVAPEDMGKGPFRWAVLSGVNGRQLAVSDNFHLPSRDMETVRAEIAAQRR